MAAKVINISDDAGSNWYGLPGGTGQFQADAEQISDTILGQNYQSNESGLITWGVTANAIWKGAAGYNAQILQPGTPTATTGETCTLLSGKIYQIDDATKEIWDRSIAVVVYDAAVDHTADVINIDYLFGKVEFDPGYSVGGAVTVDVTYLPTIQLAKGNSYTLTMTADSIDNSDFGTVQGNSGYRTFIYGLKTVSLEMTGIYNSTDDMCAVVEARSELIFEVDAIGDGLSVARGFFKVTSAGQSGDVGALEEETITASLNVPDVDTAVEPDVSIPFGWQHGAQTTLDTSIQKMLTSWTDEAVIDVQYLPLGVIGQSPLDGVEGNMILTDISLTGGLSDMNTFNATMQGSDEYTVV